jgi:hypothetical protein
MRWGLVARAAQIPEEIGNSSVTKQDDDDKDDYEPMNWAEFSHGEPPYDLAAAILALRRRAKQGSEE